MSKKILKEIPLYLKRDYGLFDFLVGCALINIINHQNTDEDIIDVVYRYCNNDLEIFTYIVSNEKTSANTLRKIGDNRLVVGELGIEILYGILHNPNCDKNVFDIIWKRKDSFSKNDQYIYLFSSFMSNPNVTEKIQKYIIDYLITNGFFSSSYKKRSTNLELENRVNMDKNMLERIRKAGNLEPLNFEKISLNMYTPEDFKDKFYCGYVLQILALEYNTINQSDVEVFIKKCFWSEWWLEKYREKTSLLKEKNLLQKHII